MTNSKITEAIKKVNNLFHNYYGLALIVAVIFATFMPELGVYASKTVLKSVTLPDGAVLKINFNIVVIQIILLNVSMCVKRSELLKAKSYILLIAGFIVLDILLGAFLAGLTRYILPIFLDFYVVQQIIVGIAIIAICPSAATSAAWSQVSGGNISLSLGMILSSTLLSPFISPFIFKNFTYFTQGEVQSRLLEVSQTGTSYFMTYVVAIPCLLGLIGHFIFEKKVLKFEEFFKLFNFTGLTVLMYTLNSTVLPDIFLGNMKFIMIIFLILCACVLNISWYMGGKTLSQVFRTEKKEKISLVIGMGVKNVTAGLVLANYSFPDYKVAFFIIMAYGLCELYLASRVKWYFSLNN